MEMSDPAEGNDNVPPDLMDRLDQVIPQLQNGRTGLVLDFDGTLSEIAPTPGEAILYPACKAPLEHLVGKLALVSVLSGRGAADIRRNVNIDGIVYVGNHGGERLVNGKPEYEPRANDYRNSLVALFEDLKSVVSVPGIVWEDKGLSMAVHYRPTRDWAEAEDALRRALDEVPRESDLDVFWGKLILEIRAPTGINKGYALRKLVEEMRLDHVFFFGDDTTDLDAVLARKDLHARGETGGFSAVVLHDDSPPRMLEECDYSLSGVQSVASFLQWVDDTVT